MKNKEKYETWQSGKDNRLLVSSLSSPFLPPHIASQPQDWSIVSFYVSSLFLIPIAFSTAVVRFCLLFRILTLAFSLVLLVLLSLCLFQSIIHIAPVREMYFPKPQLWPEKRSLQDITIPVFKCSQGRQVEEREDFWTEIKVESKEGRVQLDINNYNEELLRVHESREDGCMSFWHRTKLHFFQKAAPSIAGLTSSTSFGV